MHIVSVGMNLKIRICVMVIILEKINFLKSFSLNSLVQFSCNQCGPNRSCCVGTLISPDLAITSTFCSTSCQSITRRGRTYIIIKRFTAKTFPNVKDIQGSSEISLTQFGSNFFSNSIVKLGDAQSFNRSLSMVQYPVLFTNQKPQLRTAVRQPCIRPKDLRVAGYYICTSKNLSDSHSCQQGIPLLINDHILGITVSSTCPLNQTIFMAIRPNLSWLKPILNPMKIEEKQHLRTETKCTRSPNATKAPTDLNTTEDIEQNFDIASEEDIIKSIRLFKGHLGLRFTTQEDEVIQTTRDTTTITNEPSIEIDQNSSTIHSFNQTSPSSGVPVAMQWFKNLKLQLKNRAPPILVLTTRTFRSITKRTTSQFSDLT